MYCPHCGEWKHHVMSLLDATVSQRLNCDKCNLMFTIEIKKPLTLLSIANLYANGEKIKAIRAIREETNLGLREAKNLTEMIYCTMHGVAYTFDMKSDSLDTPVRTIA